MRTAASLLLASLLIVAPVLAVSKKTDSEPPNTCEARGGCWMVSEYGFKKAMVNSFMKGFALAESQCKGSL